MSQFVSSKYLLKSIICIHIIFLKHNYKGKIFQRCKRILNILPTIIEMIPTNLYVIKRKRLEDKYIYEN